MTRTFTEAFRSLLPPTAKEGMDGLERRPLLMLRRGEGAGLTIPSGVAIGAFQVSLIASFIFLASEAIDGNAVVFDEFAHVPAGITHWESGRFAIYRENPPLVRMLAALPAWLSDARIDYSRAGIARRSEWHVGWDFVRANGPRHREIFRRSRLVVVALAVACGLLVFRWARQVYTSSSAPLVCMAVWLMDPNVLAHGSIATTDIGTAALGFLASYAFWCYLQAPGVSPALWAGLTLGLAQASKFSMLVLYPAWLLIALADRREASEVRRWRARDLAAIAIVSLLVLNAVYLFEGTGTPLGSFDFHSALLGGRPTPGETPGGSSNRFRGTPLGSWLVLLPRDYVLGFDSQKWDEEIGLANLEGGRLVLGGHWYSPLLTAARKLPPGSLLLIAASAALFYLRRRPRLVGAVLWIPPLAIVGLLCSQTGLNWPIRYSVPAFPYLAVAAGGIVEAPWPRKRVRWLVVACLAWNGVELVLARPAFLSYGSPLAGGRDGAQRRFLGSNYDWGQDLFRLKRWADEHPEVRPLCVSSFGVLSPPEVGLAARGLPLRFLEPPDSDREPPPAPAPAFFWAVSSNYLNGLPGWFTFDDGSRSFASLRPSVLRPEQAFARVGATIFVFAIPPTPDPSARPGPASAEFRSYLERRVMDSLSTTP